MAASDAIRELLEIRGIKLTLNTVPTAVEDGWLQVSSGNSVRADRVIALPRLEGHTARRRSAQRERLRRGRRARAGLRPGRRLGGRRSDQLLDQAGRPRYTAGRRRSRVDRSVGRSRSRTSAVRSRSARAAPDRAHAALHSRRAHRRTVRFRHGAALVASCEDRRALSGAVPGYASSGSTHRTGISTSRRDIEVSSRTPADLRAR